MPSLRSVPLMSVIGGLRSMTKQKSERRCRKTMELSSTTGMGIYLFIGTMGGLIGSRLKMPGGTLMGAMMAIVVFKMMLQRDFDVPKAYNFFVQVLIGIMVGASYSYEMNRLFLKIIGPVILSTAVLIAAGLAISFILVKIGLLDASTAYLSTSPGAMSAMVTLAGESNANSPVVLAFHFFRIAVIILTAPFVFRLIQTWFGRTMG